MSSNLRNPKSPHLSNTTSPLLSALQNPSELISRSIPFPTFIAGSSPSSVAPNSLGSASGGVGLSGGPSPPPSAPASYSSGGGFSAPRQVRGYAGFEEQYSGPYGSAGTYYNSTQRYPHGSPNAQLNGGAHLQPGESRFACELATVDELGWTGTNARVAGGNGAGGDNVVCLGYDGGVDIWRVGRSTVEQIGRLEGLKGSVKGAKILPNPPLNDPLAAYRPLICLTVHSPVIQEPGSDADNGPTILLEVDSPYSTSPPSRPETSASHRSSQNGDLASDWQTTVEVWSLSARTRLCKLFTSPLIPIADIGFGIHAPPPVWGNLRVQVSGDRIVVGVGSSGELYVFGIEAGSNGGKRGVQTQQTAEWKCLEKVWTSIQYPSGQNFSSDGATGLGLSGGTFGISSVGTPVFSLSDRWLAYCPASTGSFSAGGEVGVPIVSSSVMTSAPPSQPAISVAVSLEDEAFLNRMAREVTQEVIRGAKWAADAGYKKLQSYWNGVPQNGNSPPHSMPSGMGMSGFAQMNGSMQPGGHPQPSGLGQQLRQMQQMGGSQPQFQQSYSGQHSHEPRLVSIVDIHKSSRQETVPPMATFLPPAGVSFLSFAPGGLSLLTASSKGDLLFIWDLLKVVHHPPGSMSLGHQRSSSASHALDPKAMAAANSDSLGRHVRQIARFTRMTVATIVDVDWSSPRGEKIAVVTERGTAHFYDLPYSALQWPPPRRPPPSNSMSPQTTAAGAAVSNAVNLFNSSTQPLLTAARRRRSRSSSVGSPGGGMFGSPSTGRRGLSVAVPGTSPNDPPTGGNKIALPPSVSGVAPGCVKFLTSKERGHVAVLGGGLLRIYELRPGGSGKKGSKTGGVASGNWWEYDIPHVPVSGEKDFVEFADGKAGGFWGFRSHWGRTATDDDGHSDGGFWKKPLAWAEIETNSASVPWHQERRVKIFVYTLPKVQSQEIIRALPAPVNWDPSDESSSSRPGSPVPTKGMKKRKSKSCTSSPSISPSDPEPLVDIITAPISSPKPQPSAEEKWVFGLPIEAERIFLSDAGGRGDVMFSGEGQQGLEAALREEVHKVEEVELQEGFFEEDVEVLDFAS
ncbi:hypothetical protein K440DRAFT_644243 [Wilcoxina mikolae CBS 423.85]|nr:hypothetical protein K440DRAFT_644243 [Wilcoxina mikolae CBS 423.85]